ncbi:hypothetical protein [Fusibacter bizertensis]
MKSKCKNIIKNMNLKSDQGSSSVLVIMIMLLLITFGVLAMMSSYSNLKIARKHAEWTKSFYQLESIADKNNIEFENLYKSVVSDVKAHDIETLPTALEDTTLTSLAKDAIQNNLLAGDTKQAKQKLFLYLLYDKFKNSNLYQLDSEVSFNYDIVNQELPSDLEAVLSYITLDEKTGRRLLTSYKVDMMNYENLPLIDQWRELPQEFQYDEGINFNDPEGN